VATFSKIWAKVIPISGHTGLDYKNIAASQYTDSAVSKCAQAILFVTGS
jgi:hypothetical protein